MKRIIFIWIALCFAVNMKALIITGKVVTDDGNALPYANIVLAVLPDSSFITGTVSGNDGTFKVASVSEQKNRLLLKISSIGYTTVIVTPVKENIGTIVMHGEPYRYYRSKEQLQSGPDRTPAYNAAYIDSATAQYKHLQSKPQR